MKIQAASLLLATCLFPALASAQHQAEPRSEPWSREILDLAQTLPVQEGGRIKPLDTFAQFTLLRLNGKRSVKTPQGERISSIEWLLDTLFFPEASADYAVFLVQNADVIQAIGISREGKRKRDRYSFNELAGGVTRLFELAREYAAIEEKNRSSTQQQIFVLANNVNSFMGLHGSMDFARHDFEVGTPSELSRIFDGMERAAFSQVLAQVVPALELYRELAADPANNGSEEQRAIAGVLQHASELAGRTEHLAILPPTKSVEEQAEWLTPSDLLFEASMHAHTAPAHVQAISALEGMARSRGRLDAFKGELERLHGATRSLAEARGEYGKIGMEVSYYKAKLLDYSQYAFVLAFLLMAFMWLRPRSSMLYLATSAAVVVPTLLLCAAIVARCVIRGRPPVSTLYETVLFVTAVGALVALVMEGINKQRIAISAAAILGAVGLFIANGYEMLDKRDTMPSLVAVLDTNFWLATHVTCITIGYSAGMLAALLGSVYLVAKAVGVKRGERSFYKNLGRMVYGVLCFGLIFSVVGTILGGIWANDSWGRFWGWDPKENGALLIVISQIVILHARMGGYLREHGVCMAAAFGGTIVAFSWWGVNLLGVGLHSYGFTSGISQAVWTYYWIEWGIVGLGALTWLRERARVGAV